MGLVEFSGKKICRGLAGGAVGMQTESQDCRRMRKGRCIHQRV